MKDGKIQVHDFGEKEGMRIYRVFGDVELLKQIIKECQEADPHFESPEILQRPREYPTMLLKIKVPAKVGEAVD